MAICRRPTQCVQTLCKSEEAKQRRTTSQAVTIGPVPAIFTQLAGSDFRRRYACQMRSRQAARARPAARVTRRLRLPRQPQAAERTVMRPSLAISETCAQLPVLLALWKFSDLCKISACPNINQRQ